MNEIERKEIQKRKKPILIGLNKIGVISCMNATLQYFLNTSKLTDYFICIYNKDKKSNDI